MVVTAMFVPYGEDSAKSIFCEKLQHIEGGAWTLIQLKKGDYWKHVRYSGRVWMKEENRFTIEAHESEEEGLLLGAFLNWVARHAHNHLWSVTLVFGEVSS